MAAYMHTDKLEPPTPTDDSREPQVPPDKLAAHSAQRIRAAASHAQVRYPGPVGDYLAGELRSYADWGFRVAPHSPLALIVDELMRPAA